MSDVFGKLKSDRLWILAIYAVVVILNAVMPDTLEIPIEQMTELGYAVIAFILGKSIRGTVGGSMFEGGLNAIVGTLSSEAGKRLPGQSEEATDPGVAGQPAGS